MRAHLLALVLAPSIVVASPAAARKTGHQPCPEATYVVQGAPLTLGAGGTPVESLRIGAGRLALGACTGAARLKATRTGTHVTAKVSGCPDVSGKLKVTALIAPSCEQVEGRAKGRKKTHFTFAAARSRCGDGFVDTAGGEQCEPPGSAGCDVRCQGTSAGGTTTTTLPSDDTDPLEVTPAGSPDGALLSGSEDATGGTLTDAATGASVEAPAGAFAGSAQITMQPVTNTLDRKRGDGVRVSADAPLAKPLVVRLPYDPATVDPAALRLAVHLADGSWQELLPRAVDTTAHTIAAALRPPAAAVTSARSRALAPQALESNYWEVVQYLGFQMKPESATVQVGKQRDFTPYSRESHKRCPQVVEECDPSQGDDCLATPRRCDEPVVVTIPLTNAKAGFFRVWYVNDVLQGDATIGTVVPHGAVGATYTAPATKPDPSVVTVEFVSENVNTNQQASVKAEVSIVTGYHVTADYTDPQDDICFCEIGNVTDHFELDLDYPDNEGALVLRDEPTNVASTVTNKMKNPFLGPNNNCIDGGGFERFDASSITTVGLGDSPNTNWILSIDGILTDSTCTQTNTLGSPPFTVPGIPTFIVGLIDVSFSESGFTDGKQTLPDFLIPHSSGRWKITVEERP
jgi:hypothetical protein